MKSVCQESPDSVRRLRRRLELSNARRKVVGHSCPHIHVGIDPRSDRSIHVPWRVIQQHLVMAHMDTDGRQAGLAAEKRRGERMSRISCPKIGADQVPDLQLSERGLATALHSGLRARFGPISLPRSFWVRSRVYACTPTRRDPNTPGVWFPCWSTAYVTARTLIQNPGKRPAGKLDLCATSIARWTQYC